MFKVLKSGKRMKKSWKRMITKVTFVGPVSLWSGLQSDPYSSCHACGHAS